MAEVDLRAFDSNVDRILAAVHNLTEGGESWPSSLTVSHYLRDKKAILLHWKTIDAELAASPGLTARRKLQGRWSYMLLDQGRDRVARAPETVSFVDPDAALQATMKLHDLLSKLVGTVGICDPYLDDATVEHLEACPKAKPIRLLTMNVRDSGRLRRLLGAARSSSYDIEIRVVASRVLHDRYIIDDASILILGTSLNGFGKKQSFVIKAGPDIRNTVVAEFDTLWSAATVWP